MVDGVLAFALGVERDSKIEARLIIEWIGEHFFFELCQGPERLGLLSNLKCCACCGNGRFVTLGLRYEGECLLGLFERAGFDVTPREPGERVYVGAVFRKQLRVDFGGAGGIAGMAWRLSAPLRHGSAQRQ